MTNKRILRTILAICIISIMIVVGGLGYVPSASATTPNTITVDCNIDTEWQPDENMGLGGIGTGSELFITWDVANLYVGVTAPTYATTVYIDTAVGGTNIGAYPFTTHLIANPGHGYEFAFTDLFTPSGGAQGLFYETGDTGAWINGAAPAGTVYCGAGDLGTDFEMAIPWASLGVAPGASITMLVTDRIAVDLVADYWPDVTGNDGTVPVFTQGYVFSAAVPGYSPYPAAGSAPTAVTLNGISSTVSDLALPFAAGMAILSLGTVMVMGRRKRTIKK